MRGKKNNKQLWTTVVIALVVAVVVSIVVALVSSGGVSLSPFGGDPYLARVGDVRAASCDADGICEVNSITSRGNGPILLSGDTVIEGMLDIQGSLPVECEVFDFDAPYNCGDFGYDYCVVEQHTKTITYYDSTNRSCAGNIQVELDENFLASCNECFPGEPCSGGGGGGCGASTTGAEPYLGDRGVGTSSDSGKTLCCRN